MSGICGWTNSALASHAPDTLMTDMIRGLGGSQGANQLRHHAGNDGLAAYSPFQRASLHDEGDIAVALEGRTEWRSKELAALARDKNPAMAAAMAYRRNGLNALADIHGPFALAILDRDQNQTLLAIDRLGIHSLYYAHIGDQLVFGSTADSVIAHPAVTPDINRQAIFNYLYCHMVPSPDSIYEGIQKLLPGQYVLLRNGQLEKGFYWRLNYTDDGKESQAALASRFHRVLRDCVQRAVTRDEVGAFLSGGTDSSTVTGVLAEIQGKDKPVDTYSIGFKAEDFDEIEYARITARHFATRAHEYYVTPQDVADAIPLIARAYDEPFGNASAVPTYFCAKKAHDDGIRLMLAGDGGDEIFGGNARYAKQKIFELYFTVPGTLRNGLLEPLAFLPGAKYLPPVQKLQSYIRQAKVPLPDRLEAYNFLHRSPLANIFDAGFLEQIDQQDPVALMRDAYQRTASKSPINRMMHLDLKQTLADNDLRKVNRMCELAGVEVRYPLLDEAMVEFSADVPAALKVKGFKLRYFFKEALRDFLPQETITKTKHGFGLPFGLWMNEHAPLRDLACDSLASFKQRGYLKPAYLDHLIEQHRTGHASYYGVMIWVVMMLEQWMQARRL
ncbi:MAG: asparagine synthase [Gammaproteobacteria bacterium]|nr:asparagine synthase [Gammaproteobacteria bacterium]